jgi:group I intron endonuclease
MIGAIYIHVNKVNGKCYVGQSINPAKRWRSKLSAYLNNPYFHRALKKHGWDGFDHQIIFHGSCTQAELNNLEQLWITTLDTCDPRIGYNLKTGGFHGKPSVETRQRMSVSAKRRVGRRNSFSGKTHSSETKQVIREWHQTNGSNLWTPERRTAQAERVRKRHWSSGKKPRLLKA